MKFITVQKQYISFWLNAFQAFAWPINTNKQNNEAYLCCFSSSRNWSELVTSKAGLFVIALYSILDEEFYTSKKKVARGNFLL